MTARSSDGGTATAGRSGLTRERIAAVALDLLDRDGLEAFSMRKLAEELGVGTMTLYGYYRNKSELLDGVMDAAGTDVALAMTGGDWRERGIALSRAVRANLERHPTLVQIRLQQRLVRPRQFKVTEAVIQSLVDGGLPRDEAARAFRVFFTYTFGFVAFSPSASADAARAELRSALAALPPGEYPLLSTMIDDAVEAAAGDEQYEYGLNLLLDGIEARVARQQEP